MITTQNLRHEPYLQGECGFQTIDRINLHLNHVRFTIYGYDLLKG